MLGLERLNKYVHIRQVEKGCSD